MPYVWLELVVIGWAVFSALAVAVTGSLDQMWSRICGLSLIVQGPIWLLLLPCMVALAIRKSTWGLWPRLTDIGAVAVANLYMFFPKGT